jgi:hypothetical protein
MTMSLSLRFSESEIDGSVDALTKGDESLGQLAPSTFVMRFRLYAIVAGPISTRAPIVGTGAKPLFGQWRGVHSSLD